MTRRNTAHLGSRTRHPGHRLLAPCLNAAATDRARYLTAFTDPDEKAALRLLAAKTVLLRRGIAVQPSGTSLPVDASRKRRGRHQPCRAGHLLPPAPPGSAGALRTTMWRGKGQKTVARASPVSTGAGSNSGATSDHGAPQSSVLCRPVLTPAHHALGFPRKAVLRTLTSSEGDRNGGGFVVLVIAPYTSVPPRMRVLVTARSPAPGPGTSLFPGRPMHELVAGWLLARAGLRRKPPVCASCRLPGPAGRAHVVLDSGRGGC